MRDDSPQSIQLSADGRVTEPLYFSSGGHDLFAWLHRPKNVAAAKLGLVICKPFGYEALCAHRSVRVFAQAAAEGGIPALRFDYAGCGDSSDIDPDADQIQSWLDNVLAAVTELRRQTGVAQVCLLGIRLGALLAVLAAARREDIRGLILLAPVISGTAYLRELNTARLAALLAGDCATPPEGESNLETAAPGSKEFSGYRMSAASMEFLSKTDLTQLPASAVGQALIIDRLDLPRAKSWEQAFCDAGIKTQYLALDGFVEMAMVAPQYARVPLDVTDAIRQWLMGFANDLGIPPEQPAMEGREAPTGTTHREVSLPAVAAGEGAVTELPVTFGSQASLFGILTRPGQEEPRRRGVIMLNAGADYHMGASRMYVSLARRWAGRGYYVLRMDLAGLGDSGTRPGEVDNEIFPPRALDDIRDAVTHLREHYGIREVSLLGLCSGAYHALRAAAAALPVERILMVNPQNYFWTEGTDLQDLQLAEVVRNPGVYRERIVSRRAWKRLLSGQVNVWRIFKIYAYRQILGSEASFRNVARALRIKLKNDLGRELENIVGRGVQVTFIFANGEPGIDLLKLQAGSSVKKLGDHCRVRIIKDADHTFSRSGPRSTMERILSDELYLLSAAPASASSKMVRRDEPVSGNYR